MGLRLVAHGAGPVPAVAPGVDVDLAPVARHLERDVGDLLSVDAPYALLRGPVTPVDRPVIPRDPGRQGDLPRRIGDELAGAVDRRLVRALHMVARVFRARLRVGFLHY